MEPTRDYLSLLAEADSLLHQPGFDKERNARAERLIQLAEAMNPRRNQLLEHRLDEHARELGLPGRHRETRETRAICSDSFRSWLRGSPEAPADAQKVEFRDGMIVGDLGGAYPGSPSGYFIPAGMADHITSMLRATDDLWKASAVNLVITKTGNPFALPLQDDTQGAATIIEEAGQTQEQDLLTASQQFLKAPTWRAGGVTCSNELLADMAFDPAQWLSAVFTIRFARGIGRYNVANLLAGAALGTVATGSSDTDGSHADGSDSVGYGDLLNLMNAVDPAYLASEKCAWVMNFSTLIALMKVKDQVSRPVFHFKTNANGDLLLFEKPIRICPSMQSIGTSGSPVTGNVPIIFGDLGRFVVRQVQGSMTLIRSVELYAQFDQSWYDARFRVQSAVLWQNTAPAPIVYLQNANS